MEEDVLESNDVVIINKDSIFNMMIGEWNRSLRKLLLSLQQLIKVYELLVLSFFKPIQIISLAGRI